MADRRVLDPKVLLAVAGAIMVAFSAIAIFLTIGYSPESDYSREPAGPVTETSTPPFQPPPPPVMLPGPGPQVPCMGWTAEGCGQKAPQPSPQS